MNPKMEMCQGEALRMECRRMVIIRIIMSNIRAQAIRRRWTIAHMAVSRMGIQQGILNLTKQTTA